MFGYKGSFDNNVKFLNVIMDGSDWKVETSLEDSFHLISNYTTAYMLGNINFVVKDATPHEQTMMRMFMLSAFKDR